MGGIHPSGYYADIRIDRSEGTGRYRRRISCTKMRLVSFEGLYVPPWRMEDFREWRLAYGDGGEWRREKLKSPLSIAVETGACPRLTYHQWISISLWVCRLSLPGCRRDVIHYLFRILAEQGWEMVPCGDFGVCGRVLPGITTLYPRRSLSNTTGAFSLGEQVAVDAVGQGACAVRLDTDLFPRPSRKRDISALSIPTTRFSSRQDHHPCAERKIPSPRSPRPVIIYAPSSWRVSQKLHLRLQPEKSGRIRRSPRMEPFATGCKNISLIFLIDRRVTLRLFYLYLETRWDLLVYPKGYVLRRRVERQDIV